jgi:hypothetical protein
LGTFSFAKDKQLTAVPSPTSTAPCQTCLYLTPSGRYNAQNNPIYTLEVYRNGQRLYEFDTVVGRWNTQRRNRHVGGTEAPLPDGQYKVSDRSVPGTIPEVGGRFISIYPQFPTGRQGLGIHYDPSYNLANGEDGTSGCIGLTSKAHFATLQHFIETYHPRQLIVDIDLGLWR